MRSNREIAESIIYPERNINVEAFRHDIERALDAKDKGRGIEDCRVHPGMSCREAHEDDAMKIRKLEEQLKDAISRCESADKRASDYWGQMMTAKAALSEKERELAARREADQNGEQKPRIEQAPYRCWNCHRLGPPHRGCESVADKSQRLELELEYRRTREVEIARQLADSEARGKAYLKKIQELINAHACNHYPPFKSDCAFCSAEDLFFNATGNKESCDGSCINRPYHHTDCMKKHLKDTKGDAKQ